MGYVPPPHLIRALNEAGLWHGRASILVAPQVRAAFEEDPYKRWEIELLEAFGGLYVTQDRNQARIYAEDAARAIENYYWPSEEGFDWAKPKVHRIFLLPDVEIALDEDAFGWSDAVGFRIPDYTLLGISRKKIRHLAEEAGVIEEIENEVSKPHFYWESFEDPALQALVDSWTQRWTEPILAAWFKRWRRYEGSRRRDPLILRLLNQEWYAEPSIADHLRQGMNQVR